MKHIYIMRHGETKRNKEHRLQGRFDEPLNETGIRQAEEAGEEIRRMGIQFDRVYSSPLQRAVKTAMLVTGLPKEDLILDERILEMDYGKYEGWIFEELPEEVWGFFREPLKVGSPEGMESMEELHRRTGEFLESLAAEADDKDENWLVVMHGIAMRALLGNLAEDAKQEAWASPIENCVLYETCLEKGRFTKGVRVQMPGRER